ncbi:O-antigen ligase family protein [Metabacillus halosaccharovorans]|uniref:O-antigen ligase family protein n=1 Tax=Metabacillus halosaccharovorans TaxID=930124 RepID=UPI0034CE3225
MKSVVYLIALLYCFVWFRIPDIAGVNLPVLRLIGWLGLIIFILNFCLRKKIYKGPLGDRFILFSIIFFANMIINFLWHSSSGSFSPLFFIMDFSKYLAAFSVAYLVYYALSKNVVNENKFIKFLMYSGIASIFLTFLSLGLYLVGFRSTNDILLKTFGNSWGVWPTASLLPRLAGTASEPQQLSIVFLTPLLLIIAYKSGKFGLIYILGIAALFLSQSKFALLSIMIVFLFTLIISSSRRKLIFTFLGLCALPFLVNFIMNQPVFAQAAEQGLDARAFQERFENAEILSNVIKESPILGIGAGQYGIYRSQVLPVEYNPGYYPNNDYLKIFGELGIIGFIIVMWFFYKLFKASYFSYKFIPKKERAIFLANLIGTITIMLNMMIGYEFLHVFFWINVGLLMYHCEKYYKLNPSLKSTP